VLFTTLRSVESVANRIPTGLMLGDAIIFILCLNEHKSNRLILTERKIPRNVTQLHENAMFSG
jgi:hypothetical protein